jgi:3',5'-cyclic-AMP phosphodiesterase
MELPRHTLVHLTDLHVEVDGAAPRFGVDSAPLVERALQVVAESGLRPSALVFTGDLAEHGRPEEYRRLRALVEPWIGRIGAPVAWVAGNHDDRAALREHLLGEPAGTEALDHVVRVGDLRIALLDRWFPDCRTASCRRDSSTGCAPSSPGPRRTARCSHCTIHRCRPRRGSPS